MHARLLRFCWPLVVLLPAPVRAAEPVDYDRQVRPLLKQRCYGCHGPAMHKASLRLDSITAMREGGDTGPAIEPGRAADSLLIHALLGDRDDVTVMPSGKDRLPAAQIQLLKDWIDQGAKGPAGEVEAPVKPTASKHWAFRAPVRPELPAVRKATWVRNPIDRFVLARLEKEGLAPSPEADRATLIRRLSLDLIGLPPSPAEVDAFVKDDSAGTYERLVDRLLASPHYGERWGRHWLDLARYADSNGYSIDSARSIWPYRDWVIDALNQDKPYDQFVIEQLAGDLLPNATLPQQVATGFHRNTPINEEGGIDREQFRVDSVVDRVNTTGAAFMGLTVGCCQCHDHKYDPLRQREYYQLFAFFNNCDEPTLPLATPEELRRSTEIAGTLRKRAAELKALGGLITDKQVIAWDGRLSAAQRAAFPEEIRFILQIPENGRDAKQAARLRQVVADFDKIRHHLGGLGQPLPFPTAGHANLARKRARLEQTVAELQKHAPNIPTSLVVRERSVPRETHVHLGGDFLRKGVKVAPGVPAVLPPLPKTTKAPTRLDLARWLVRPDHPLTARVAVNRVWQQHFGLGLVETENDFGTQGTPPSHPELLDWLATEFVRSRWGRKALHKLIVTSATYRQASKVRPELATLDPRNRLLARMPRLRLEAEVVRDNALAVSGLLNPKIGGPSVFPPQPEGVANLTQVNRPWKASVGPDRYRRGLYTYFWRSNPHPSLTVFDAPDATGACTRRNRSNTPLQALTLLNDAAFHECAEALGARVLKEGGTGDAERLRYAFRLCVARPPGAIEMQRLTKLLGQLRETGAKDRAVWATVGRVLLNLDETIARE